jgi:hypothetical protein
MVLPCAQLRIVTAIAPTLLLPLPALAVSPSPDVAQHLPADTAYVMLLDMRPETWQQLDRYALFQALQAQGMLPPNPGGLPFLPPELDYDRDIAPWVGDTTAVALLPLGTPRVTEIVEHEILLAPIAQPAAFKGFVDTVTDWRGQSPETQRFQAVPILYWEPEYWDRQEVPPPTDKSPARATGMVPGMPSALNGLNILPETLPDISWPETPEPDVPGLAIAVFPDLLVAAEDPAAIRTWLTLQPDGPEASLANQPKFQRTLAHPQFDAAFGAFYGNLGEIVKYSLVDFNLPALPWPLPPLPEAVTPAEVAQLAALQLDTSLEVLVYPTQHGLRLQGRGYFDETQVQSLLPTWQPISGQTLKAVPGNAYGLLSSRNLAGAWQQLTMALAAGETTAEYLNQARSLFQLFTGLDLDRDFFGWMDGDFTVFLFPTDATPLTLFFEDLPIGLGIALQTSDRAAAEYAFAQLDDSLGAGFVTVEDRPLGDQTLSSWAIDLNGDGSPDSFLGHGWARDDTLLITTSVASLVNLLNLEPGQRLPNALTFRRSIQDYPAANQGYLFANMSSLRSLLYRLLPEVFADPAGQDFRQTLGLVQSLSGTLSATDEYVQVDGLLLLVPAPTEDTHVR